MEDRDLTSTQISNLTESLRAGPLRHQDPCPVAQIQLTQLKQTTFPEVLITFNLFCVNFVYLIFFRRPTESSGKGIAFPRLGCTKLIQIFISEKVSRVSLV